MLNFNRLQRNQSSCIIKYSLFSVKLLCLQKQQYLLEEHGYAILNQRSENAESLKKEDCKLLKNLIFENYETSEENYQFKKFYYNLGFDLSSSNVQIIASNLTVSAGSLNASCLADIANLSVDFFCLFFWNFFLADFFSSEVVDSLALNNLNSGGETF